MPVLREIESQVRLLPYVFEWVKGSDLNDVIESISGARKILYIGCGSSYYAGLTLSKYTMGILKKPARAIPGGEILTAMDWNVVDLDGTVAILISRSGETTEVVESVNVLKQHGTKTVGITLEESSSLASSVDIPVILPYDESSIVMTSSFTGIVLTLQMLIEISALSFDERVYRMLLDSLGETVKKFKSEAEEFSNLSHYVFLGSGPYEGIARESALKLQEMSLTYTEAYTTLDYRHGPKSLVDDRTLVVIFGDDEEERKLANEIEKLGGKVSIRKRLLDSYRDSFVQVIFSQFLGFEIALRKGIDVESPRHLTKVVRLDG